MGSSQRHLDVKLEQQQTALRSVAFGCAEWADELAAVGGPIDIAYKPTINEFRGRRRVELQLVDWRVADRG
jgi:single-stranded-DNA-specific exonuclease